MDQCVSLVQLLKRACRRSGLLMALAASTALFAGEPCAAQPPKAKIAVAVALTGARARATLRPLVDQTILLTHPRFVLKPDLHGRPRGQVLGKFRQTLSEVFYNDANAEMPGDHVIIKLSGKMTSYKWKIA